MNKKRKRAPAKVSRKPKRQEIIPFEKASTPLPISSSLSTRNSFFAIIREVSAGAWQRNEELRIDNGLSNPVLFRCVTLIANDIAKMDIELVAKDADGISTETENPAYSPVLRKPNDFQDRIQFTTQWMLSKLLHGNTYVLKSRDDRGVVNRLVVLDFCSVTPLVAESGDVFYQCRHDPLAGIGTDGIIVPASEIIHDRMNTFWHPLIGISPIFACGLAALLGIQIQRGSSTFFSNGSRPSGVLSAPGAIGDETLATLKTQMETYRAGGINENKTLVVGDGLEYTAIAFPAQVSQLIEQLKHADEQICTAYGVPAYMAGVGPAPLNNNVEALEQQYYGQCLQIYTVSFQSCLAEGLELNKPYGIRLDLDDLLLMDTASRIDASIKSISGALTTTNEERKRFDNKPVEGGDSIRAQQQQFDIAALAERDQNDPFSKPAPAPAADPSQAANDNIASQAAFALDFILKELVA